jgi:hypothetical protein
VLLGCALRPSEVAALTDGRCSGGFTPEAAVARHADARELTAWCVRHYPHVGTMAVAATDNASAGAGTGRRASGCAKRLVANQRPADYERLEA